MLIAAFLYAPMPRGKRSSRDLDTATVQCTGRERSAIFSPVNISFITSLLLGMDLFKATLRVAGRPFLLAVEDSGAGKVTKTPQGKEKLSD